MGAYDKYIQQEKIKGWVHTLSSAILKLISEDEDLSSNDAVEILKQSTDRVVVIISKTEGKKVDDNG